MESDAICLNFVSVPWQYDLMPSNECIWIIPVDKSDSKASILSFLLFDLFAGYGPDGL